MNDIDNAAKWEGLRVFTVEVASGTDRLFSNGRQQVELRIAIEANDVNATPVPLSDRELASLRLVEYHGGKEIPLRGAKWSYAFTRATEYRYYPSNRSRSVGSDLDAFVAPFTAGQHTTYRHLYVMTTADAPLRIAAKITRDDGEEFVSSAAQDGSVTLIPVELPSYRTEDYTLKAAPIYLDFADCIPFVLMSGSTNIEFREFSITPSSVVKGHWASNGKIYGLTYIGYTNPGQSGVHYGEGTFSYFHDLDSKFVKPGQPVIVRVYHETPVPRSTNKGAVYSSSIVAVDMYGNDHSLNIRFKNKEIGDLELELF